MSAGMKGLEEFAEFAFKARSMDTRNQRAAARAAMREAADRIATLEAEVVRLRDSNDGLTTDLRMAVEVAYQRGAIDWARLNYPQWFDWLKSNPASRAALAAGEGD